MSRQVITKTAPPQASPALRAWGQLLRGHAATTRLLSAELQEHGLTINDYEALFLLSQAEGGRLKRVDLARYEAAEWQKRNELVSALLNAMLRMERQRRRGFALDPPDGSGLPAVLRRVK